MDYNNSTVCLEVKGKSVLKTYIIQLIIKDNWDLQ